jgi:archaellum component FlaC
MMTTKNPEDSVRDEQFDGTEKSAESLEETTTGDDVTARPADAAGAVGNDEIPAEAAEANDSSEAPVAGENVDGEPAEVSPEPEEKREVRETAESSDPEAGEIAETTGDTDEAEDIADATGDTDEAEDIADATGDSDEAEDIADATGDSDEAEDIADITGDSDEAVEQVEERINYDDIELPPVDYSGFSRKELVETLALIVENRPPAEILDDVNRIKEFFYKKTKAEFNEKRLNFAKEGGNIEEYRPEPDELENRIKTILETYRNRRSDFNRIQESEKQENLRRKVEIIEQIKDLVNREEAINKTFQEFRNLQNEWHATGIVPQSAVKDLWENYHHSVEIFYDYIKINRELRDLDLRKNLEAKITLCEKAEELLLEPNAVNAFKLLQDYHNQWREIGPVPHENKNDIWERFREATTKVNKRHHEFFEKQKDDQKRNLDAKTALCEKVEEIAAGEILTFADFREKSDAILECQKLWKTIGFAPKKHNNKIYQRFRAACDSFFEKKRSFFAENKETQVRNLQLKTELCMKAEALQESTDWKDTSEMLIRLQKEWKEIGPVPKKYSEKIWKRFRKACDTFFTRKSEFFAGRDTSYEDNLRSKLAILDELEAFDPGEDLRAGFEQLKEIQKRWTEIGYVPFNRKEEIARRYKEVLNKQFDKLKLDDEDKNILRYRSKVDSAKSNPRAARKVRGEREKFYSKIKQLESDIVLWENNIGFFAKSANADSMIREVEEKIAEARRNIKILEEKVKLIDNSMYEE